MVLSIRPRNVGNFGLLMLAGLLSGTCMCHLWPPQRGNHLWPIYQDNGSHRPHRSFTQPSIKLVPLKLVCFVDEAENKSSMHTYLCVRNRPYIRGLYRRLQTFCWSIAPMSTPIVVPILLVQMYQYCEITSRTTCRYHRSNLAPSALYFNGPVYLLLLGFSNSTVYPIVQVDHGCVK